MRGGCEWDKGNYVGAKAYAEEAVTSLSRAVLRSPHFHDAFEDRAQLYSRLCKPGEAYADREKAISIALSKGDSEAAEKYRSASLASCQDEFQD